MDPAKQTLFSVLSAVVGLGISLMLRSQGVLFAKNEDISKVVMSEYYRVLNKTKKKKKLHTITWFMAWSLVGDIFTKLITMAASTYLVIFIFIEGNGDWSLIGLSLTNILMFICFGLLALNKAYDKYLNEHIPVIIEITERLKKGGKENEVQ